MIVKLSSLIVDIENYNKKKRMQKNEIIFIRNLNISEGNLPCNIKNIKFFNLNNKKTI